MIYFVKKKSISEGCGVMGSYLAVILKSNFLKYDFGILNQTSLKFVIKLPADDKSSSH